VHGTPDQMWPRWAEMLGLGRASGFAGEPAAARVDSTPIGEGAGTV
jgi:hypothetical protein